MGPIGKENFDLKLRLADMDRAGVDMQILSRPSRWSIGPIRTWP
jgi:hypothetical protein